VAIVVPFVIYAMPGVVGGDQGYVVLSGSMEPVASPGDAIIVEEVNPSRIEAGDIVAFRTKGKDVPTTHRVVSVIESPDGSTLEFITQGDANEDTDAQPVQASQVEGRILSVNGHLMVIPYIGHVILFIETPMGFGTLVVLPIALLVLSELWSVVRSTRADEDEANDTAGSTEPSAGGPRPGFVAVDGGSTAAEEDSGTEITISRGELRLVVPVLAAFAVYSVWIVTNVFSPVTMAVAVGAGLLLLFALLLYVGAGWSSDPITGTRQVVLLGSGSAPLPTVEVETFDDLLSIARSRNRQIAWDPERRRFRTVGGPVSFAYDGDPTEPLEADEDPTLPVDLREGFAPEEEPIEDDPWETLFDPASANRPMSADGGSRRRP
jgi:signal peptidase